MKNKNLKVPRARMLLTMLCLLVVGIGQMWAGSEALNSGNLKYTFNGGAEQTYNYSSSDSKHENVPLGTLTGSFVFTSASFQFSDDWKDHGSNNPFLHFKYTKDGGTTWTEVYPTSWDYDWSKYWIYKNPWNHSIASSSDASGNYTLTYLWRLHWSSGTDKYNNNSGANYSFTYTVLPPSVNSFNVTEANHVHGTGTEDDPYILPYNGTLSLTISGSQAHTDANSSAQYYNTSVSSDWSTTATKSISSVTSTTKTSVTVKMRYKHKTESLTGAESSATIWYQADANLRVDASVATASTGRGTVSPSSVYVGNYYSQNVTATPNTGYYLTSWTPSANVTLSSSTANPVAVTATAAGTVQANFAPKWAVVGGNSGSADGDDAMGDWSTTANEIQNITTAGGKTTGWVNITLEANTTYQFKLYNNSLSGTPAEKYYSYNGEAENGIMVYPTNDNDPWTLYTNNNNSKITTAGKGTYKFTWNSTDHKLTVDFPTSYSVTYSYDTGGSAVSASGSVSGDVTTGQYVASGEDVTFTATAATGYTFSKWVDENGDQVSTSNPYTISSISADKTLVAKFTPNPHKISFNLNGGDRYASTGGTYTEGGVQKIDVTYDAALPTPANMPKAQKDGYEFLGWYTAASDGTCLLTTWSDKTGVWYGNVVGYTNSGNWKRDADVTLYAVYQRGDINYVSFDNTWIMPGGEVTATTNYYLYRPEGNYTLCYVLTTEGGEILQVQPEFVKNDASHTVTFNAPATTGYYRLQVRLYRGAGLNCGSDISSYLLDTYDNAEDDWKFYVMPTNTVTVLYQSGGVDLRPATTVQATAYLNKTSVTAPEIPGLAFTSWTKGSHITTSDALTANPISINTTRADTLIAEYSQGPLYFKKPADWGEDVYVYMYTNTNYWRSPDSNTEEGTGSNASEAGKDVTVTDGFKMELVEGTDDVYAYDLTTSAACYAITNKKMDSYKYFAGTTETPCKVVRVTNPASSTPLIVPTGSGTLRNANKARYYDYDRVPLLADWGWTIKFNCAGTQTSHKLVAEKMGSLVFKTKITVDRYNYNYQWNLTNNSSTAYGKGTSSTWYTVKYKGDVNNNPISGLATSKNNVLLLTSTPGEYEFTVTYGTASTYVTDNISVAVTYPLDEGDYRLIYTDDDHTTHPSDVIHKRADGEDIVSMFYDPTDDSPALSFQTCTDIDVTHTKADDDKAIITWGSTSAIDLSSFGLTKAGVYNFTIKQNGSGVPSVDKVEPYTGRFYIRTDCVNSDKWDFKKSKDAHAMTYSDYSTTLTDKPYSHYFIKDIHGETATTNIRFTVATDYSDAICDTVFDGDASGDYQDFFGSESLHLTQNVRFTYNQKTNKIWRAYTEGPTNNEYMRLRSTEKVYLNTNTNTKGDASTSIKFADMGNWVYQVDVWADPGAYIKLTADIHNKDASNNDDTTPAHSTRQYLKGVEGDADYDEDDAVLLLGGTEGDAQHIRITYDFKTDRMVTAWMPSGSALGADLALHADVMLIRRHQEAGASITFSSDAVKITDVQTVYGVIQLDSATLNDVTLSQYERDLFWISFPFDVKLSDVFGFGEYMRHWGIQYYDGKNRAKNGYWVDSNSNWKFFTPGMRDTTVLKANEGYVLAVDLDLLGDGADVWNNKVNKIYLYFPSTANLKTIKNIADTLVRIDTAGYKCTIDRRSNKEVPNYYLDRRVIDSHWHLIGAPSFAGAQRTYSSSYGEGIYSDIPNIVNADWSTVNLPFIYEWNSTYNTLSPVKTGTYTFKPMHSYLVQYGKDTIRWTSVVNAPPVVAGIKAHQTKKQDCDLTLALLRGENSEDQTFIRLTDNEEVTDNFEFNHDLTKEMNRTTANIWTVTADGMPAAGNSLPFSDETKIVPIGVKTSANGNYTFTLPEGIHGVGVVLVDNVANVRTNLSMTDYTVNLEAGTFEGRFSLEISPISQSPTDIGNVQGDEVQSTKARKMIIDGVLYIVKDGEVFDARGAIVK